MRRYSTRHKSRIPIADPIANKAWREKNSRHKQGEQGMAHGNESLAAFIESLGAVSNVGAISDLLDAHVKSLGFDKFAYHVIRPPKGPRVPFS